MENNNLVKLINAINHISLNHEDLMEAVLEFSKLYAKNNKADEKIIDAFFGNNIFVEQSLMSARESVVLAMNAITLEKDIPFERIIEGCINIESQREAEVEICADEDTKLVMKKFLSELRKELFSRVYSKNKNFNQVANLPKALVQKRYELFMNEGF